MVHISGVILFVCICLHLLVSSYCVALSRSFFSENFRTSDVLVFQHYNSVVRVFMMISWFLLLHDYFITFQHLRRNPFDFQNRFTLVVLLLRGLRP